MTGEEKPAERETEREMERLGGGGGIKDEGHSLPEVFHSVAVAGYSSPDCTCTAQKVCQSCAIVFVN